MEERKFSMTCTNPGNLNKIYMCLLHLIARELMLLLVNNLHQKTLPKSKTDKILKVCALFVIFICVTTLHLCYMRMHFLQPIRSIYIYKPFNFLSEKLEYTNEPCFICTLLLHRNSKYQTIFGCFIIK